MTCFIAQILVCVVVCVTLYFMRSPPGLDRDSRGSTYSVLYITKMTERYNEPLKIETDIRQGGSVRVCEK